MSKIKPFEKCSDCFRPIPCDWCLGTLQRKMIKRIKEIDPQYSYIRLNKYGK